MIESLGTWSNGRVLVVITPQTTDAELAALLNTETQRKTAARYHSRAKKGAETRRRLATSYRHYPPRRQRAARSSG